MTAPTFSTATSHSTTAAVAGRRVRAVVQSAYGDANVLSLAEIAVPTIGKTEVLVQVRAAGLARGSWHLMTGRPFALRLAGFGVRAPKNPVLAGDIAGVVVAVGADVSRFTVGDEVFGEGTSSFAEFSAADETKLAH